MFKALLKTLPSLSGNMKLSCFVDNYKKHNKTYTCKVKVAKLLPISHTLFDKNIFINLKNNNFEYDVKTFYKNYFNIFYQSNYSFSKVNIPIIDFTEYLPDTNEDFLFGCKRISYKKYENQLAFFAPIYIENINDIKDKYFKITCIFEKVNKITRELIIDIYNNEDGENYLADYLKRYANKIDDKVIYMSSTYKNMYYGIDLLHGGFVRVEDNISKNIYKKYYTINDFDALINFGFKRNAIMMKQIIPLSFYFNPQDLLTDYEKGIYKDAKLTIFGEWYTYGNDESEKFYNFSDNYSFLNESIYQLTENNVFSLLNTSNNIMNMEYPAFKEASSENYKYINTVVKNYNRWKLKYSSDNYPYIINNNFAFSANQNSLYGYKEFPLLYKSKYAICKFKGDNYNMLFDLDNIYNNNYNLLNIKSEYYNYFNKNYITNFYSLLVKNDTSSNSEYEDIFSNSEYWTTIGDDNKLYYKGVLYDFNILYSQYKNMPKIDKFGIFVNPEMMSSITNYEYNATYNSVKYILHNCDFLTYIMNNSENVIDDINISIYKYDFINDNLSYIMNNEIVYNDINCAIQDKGGDYVDFNNYYKDQNKLGYLHYSDNNLYVDVNEILLYANLFINSANQTIYDDIYNNQTLNIIHGYRFIDVNHKNNILSDLYSKLLTIYPNKKYQFNNGMIYNEHRFLENDDIYWAYDKLYFSIYSDKTKYKLLENSQLLDTLDYDAKITLYFETDFILYNDLKVIYDFDNDSNFNDNSLINLNKYYVTNTLYDKHDKQPYSDIVFVNLTHKENQYGKCIFYNFPENENATLNNFYENVLFIDTFNLNNFYLDFFKEESTDLFKFYHVENCYCNFLNIEHMHKYFEKICENENLNAFSNLSNEERLLSILDTIYVKIHLFNNIVIDFDNNSNINYINTTTRHIKLLDFFNIKPNNNMSVTKMLDYLSYNDNGYFYFTNNYFIDFNDYLDNLPYSIHNFELCFKKTMGVVNENLYNLIMQSNSHNIYKDLYLYKIYDNSDYKFEYVLNNVKLDSSIFENANLGGQIELSRNAQWEKTQIYNDDCIELYPYFNSIFNEEKQQTKIYNDTFLNNIIRCETNNENSYVYKYGIYSIDYLTYFPKNDQNNIEGLCKYRYSLYEKYNNCIIDSYTFINKFMDYDKNYIKTTYDENHEIINETIVDNIGELENLELHHSYEYHLNPSCSYYLAYNSNYHNYNKMITYNFNNTTYGFYIIHEEFDNTCNTLNLLSDNLDKINVVSYINGIDSTSILNNQNTYLSLYYHNLVPYINNSNIVKDFLNNVNIVIKPNKYTLTNIYQQTPNNDENNNTTYSYNIILKGKTSLQLLRYFDNIVPYIYESNNITSYYLYYKNTDKFIENDLFVKKISYVMYQKSHSIYDNKQISYFDNTIRQNVDLEYSNFEISKFSPVEYKNYNNNKFYNLEYSFVVNPISFNLENKNLFTKSEIEYYENNKEYIYNLFKTHLLNENNMLTENDILFLYKKYDVSFSHNITSFHKDKNNERDYDLYTLTIKYNLL